MLFGFVLFPSGAFAGEAAFEQANRLYEQGKYAEAAAAYAGVTSNAPTSAAWFNLGNAQFKAGKLGEAIAAWKAARSISPRDAAIRANLEFGRSKVSDSAASSILEGALSYFTPNEWATATAVALGLGFLILAAAELRRGRGATNSNQGASVAFIAALLLGVAAGVASYQATRPSGVINANQVSARFGPLEDSQVSFQTSEGVEVTIEDQTPQWFQIRDKAGRTGWVRRSDVVTL